MDASLGGGDTNQCLSSSCKKSSNKSTIQIAAAVVFAFVLIVIALIIILWIVRYRKRKELEKGRFTYSEILRITNNLEKIVGRGGFGTVYHGHIGHLSAGQRKQKLQCLQPLAAGSAAETAQS